MPCKVCDHAIQRLNDGVNGFFWCPRCGTIHNDIGFPKDVSPKTIERVRQVVAAFDRGEQSVPVWEQLVATLRETVGLTPPAESGRIGGGGK